MDSGRGEVPQELSWPPRHSFWHSDGWLQQVPRLLVFVIAFLVAYRFGMSFAPEYPSPFWFPSSILLCALLLTPRRSWWMYLVAPLPIRFLLFVPPPGASPWFLPSCALIDSLSAVLAAWHLSPDRTTPSLFESLPGFARYLGMAVFLAPALSAFAGSAISIGTMDFWTTWQLWFLGNTLVHLGLTPALYCSIRAFRNADAGARRHPGEALLLAAGVAFSSYMAFCPPHNLSTQPPFLLYLPVPCVLWAAARFEPRGTAFTLCAVSLLAVLETIRCPNGPFAAYTGPTRMLEVQLFLLFLASPFLSLSVLFKDRELGRKRLRELSDKIVVVQEAERFRIAQELHDDLAQRLVALSWGVAGLAGHAKGNERFATECSDLRRQATDICNDIVRLSHELRPAVLERLGLAVAIQTLCDRSATLTQTLISFERTGDPSSARIPPNVELALYRVAQEGLRNALTHSRADRVEIQLAECCSKVTLTIHDHGCGFEIGSRPFTGLGLSGMQDRTQNVGGTLQIVSTPGIGTRVTASAPLGRSAL